MARWSRSRLRVFGIGAVAALGGLLLVVPAVSQAEEKPARPGASPARAAADRPDRIVSVAGRDGRSAFEFKAGTGDPQTPYAFVSTGGTVRAQRLGVARPVAQAPTGAPKRSAQAATAAAAGYKTTFTTVSDNWTAWNKFMGLWNRDTWSWIEVTNPQNSMSATATLPPGNYYVTSMYGIYGVDSYLLTKAFTVTDKAQTVKLEESSAKQVALKVDDSTARTQASAVWMSLPNGDLVGFSGGYGTKNFATTASTPGTTLRVHEVLTKTGASALHPSPYRYDLMKNWAHPVPASPVKNFVTASLAKTTTRLRAQGVNTDASYLSVPVTGEWTGAFLDTPMRVPATVTEYVTPGVTMSRLVRYGDSQYLNPADRTLSAGAQPAGTIGAAPLSPTRRQYNDDSRRYRNQLELLENYTLGDADGNYGYDYAETTALKLSSGGQVLGSGTGAGLTVTVPAQEQTYQFEQTTARKVAGSQLSTRIRSEWTFSSGGPAYNQLPLMDLAMAASGLDDRNRAGSAPVGLTFKPSTRNSSAAGKVDKAEWSDDDGRTWTELPLTGSTDGAEASLTVPATAAFVSLRTTVSNADGGELRRTVLRALAGPATSGDEQTGGTTITNLRVNEGKPLVVTTSGQFQVPATFTASDPSGIAKAGLHVWHGSYNTPDGVLPAATECAPVNDTTAECTAYISIWNVRQALNSNALAGAWKVEAWASAKDGAGFVDRHNAGTLTVKRGTRLTANATPEPVTKGKTITATGVLTRADWGSWTWKPYAAQTLKLQFIKRGTTTWTTPKSVTTNSAGTVKPTVKATVDGSFRFVFAGDAASASLVSAADYIDVK